jgi:hypothetical protein
MPKFIAGFGYMVGDGAESFLAVLDVPNQQAAEDLLTRYADARGYTITGPVICQRCYNGVQFEVDDEN